jgi:MoaA/NifB/PqqE/SkfB family radical SAM enzyme
MECPYIPLTPYSDFSLRLHEQAAGQRIPLVGSLEVTERCNLGCAHCYINLPAGDYGARRRELITREMYQILDQVVDEGCLWLLLTGGEPFVRPDFLDIYTYAKKKGLLVTLFTNGTTVTPRIADHLAEWRPFAVEITLYGATQETYERVTGVKGSFERCMRGIQLLLERGLPLKLKTMVMTLNQAELGEMRALARILGVEFRYDPVLNVRLDGGRSPQEFRIPAEDVVALDLADEQRMQGWRDFQEQYAGPPAGRGLARFTSTRTVC